MKRNTYFLNILLTGVVAALCLWAMLVRIFAPLVLLPRISIPMLVAVTALVLCGERYFGGSGQREWIGSTVLAALTMTVLPLCAGLTGDLPVWLLFAVSAAVFAVTTLLYTAMCERMNSAPAPAVNAVLLCLAAQFFQGIL